ncbi:hypothetical protein ACCO45_013156 [Purpureocillium lilacinum]|uniref:Uncharacterized protein n=1 Tax=Purpureocillium lilacinum TaxID=33203 RepID=A0ACC4DD36_PURLI
MSYGQQSQNPYYQAPAPQQESGYQPANPYAQDQYEMQDYGNQDQYGNQYGHPYGGTQSAQQPQQSQQSRRPVMSQSEFLDRVKSLRDDIRGLTSDIDTIGQLHQRTLSSTDPNSRQQLDRFVAETQSRNTVITDEIKRLERDVNSTEGPERNTKKPQFDSLKTFFKSELDKYHSIERDYEQKYREQIARQYRIVNPDATEQEVQEASQADWGNEGVFQTALRTNRTAHASSLLGNVRARHNELTQIENTLAQLSELYVRLAETVETQEAPIQTAEDNAQKTVENIEQGNEQVKRASDHARRARKLKWWCFFIVCLIILAVALGVGLGICLTGNKCGGK